MNTARVSLLLISVFAVPPATADLAAVDLDPAACQTWAYPVLHTNHGWEFSMNESVEVTHLGLLDVGSSTNHPPEFTPDGFKLAHPIGIFKLDGTLVTSGTLLPGTGGIVQGIFRYVSVPHAVLTPNVHYVVAYYTESYPYPDVDWAAFHMTTFQTHPAVNYINSRYNGAGGLALPTILEDPNGVVPHRFGPNFLFVPEPGSSLLLTVLVTTLSRRRKAGHPDAVRGRRAG